MPPGLQHMEHFAHAQTAKNLRRLYLRCTTFAERRRNMSKDDDWPGSFPACFEKKILRVFVSESLSQLSLRSV